MNEEESRANRQPCELPPGTAAARHDESSVRFQAYGLQLHPASSDCRHDDTSGCLLACGISRTDYLLRLLRITDARRSLVVCGFRSAFRGWEQVCSLACDVSHGLLTSSHVGPLRFPITRIRRGADRGLIISGPRWASEPDRLVGITMVRHCLWRASRTDANRTPGCSTSRLSRDWKPHQPRNNVWRTRMVPASRRATDTAPIIDMQLAASQLRSRWPGEGLMAVDELTEEARRGLLV